MKQCVLSIIGTVLLVTSFASKAATQTLSNRHHLSGCSAQSAPIVIPYADFRTVRLGLPADLEGRAQIAEIYGHDEETRLRLRRRGISVQTQGGGATLVMPHQSGC